MAFRWCCSTIVIVSLVNVWGGESTAARTADIRREIDHIRALALSVPPDIGADVLLELVTAGAIRDREMKIETLREAFQLAAQARFPRKRMLRFGAADTRSGSLRGAYTLNLDTESLRLRAIQLILPDQPVLAREMFSSLPRQDIGRQYCDDRLMYDPRLYYETLVLLTNKAFTAAEVERETHIDFLLPYIEALSSPVQVVPFVQTLLLAELNDEQFRRVSKAFEEKLVKVEADDRAFLDGDELIETMDKLARAYQDHHVPLDDLVSSVRAYIVHQLAAVRCPDSIERIIRSKATNGNLPVIARKFNDWPLRFPPNVYRELPSLRDEEVELRSVGPAIKDHPYWVTPMAKELLAQVQALRFESRGRPVPPEKRISQEWLKRARATIKKLQSWKPEDGDSAEDYFHQKCDIYEVLVAFLPPIPERTALLDQYAKFLSMSSLQLQSPAEWFMHARFLMGEVRDQLHRDRVQSSGITAEEQDILNTFERTGNPILSLYSRVEHLKMKLRAGA